VDLQNKPENFTQLYLKACADGGARAKVPMLEVQDGDTTTLIESMVVLEYLEDIAPERLNAKSRANARLFATLFQPALSYIPILKAEPGSDDEAAAIDALRTGLRAIDSYLTSHGNAEGPFLLGERFSLAEAATAPFAQRFAAVLPGLRPDLDPQSLMRDDGLTRLASWLEAVCERESCVATLPPTEELVTNYKKLLERMASAA